MVALFIVGFFFMFVSFTAGIRGCWKTSPSNITASAILMLIACEYNDRGVQILSSLISCDHPSILFLDTFNHRARFVGI